MSNKLADAAELRAEVWVLTMCPVPNLCATVSKLLWMLLLLLLLLREVVQGIAVQCRGLLLMVERILSGLFRDLELVRRHSAYLSVAAHNIHGLPVILGELLPSRAERRGRSVLLTCGDVQQLILQTSSAVKSWRAAGLRGRERSRTLCESGTTGCARSGELRSRP